MSKVPNLKFNNGVFIPVLGLGTWQGPRGREEEVGQAVKDAIDIGYRHLDCAPLYRNEKIIGEAIAAKIADGTVKREDLFITSKLGNTSHHPDYVERALRRTLNDLRLDYLDLYLIHWPICFKGPPGKQAEVGQAVKDAIDIGYRHFDCSPHYRNEKIIGEAIAAKITDGTVKREDLFITSKLGNTSHRPAYVETALRRTLNDLRLDYLDLYLIHWPFSLKESDDLYPRDLSGKLIYSDVDYVDTWKAMEDIYAKGLARAIGISNFNSLQIERVLKHAKIVPATNQVECQPYLNQKKLRQFCSERGITMTAYSPLGSPLRPWQKPGEPIVLEDAQIRKIAEQYEKTPAQILLRYQIQLGNITIPKSSNKQRLAQNIDIFDFELAPETMLLINSFDCNGRLCPNIAEYTFSMDVCSGCLHICCRVMDHPYYPFKPEVEF